MPINSFEAWVPGVPVPQPRPRARRGGRGVRNPPAADAWKAQIAEAFEGVAVPAIVPVGVRLNFMMPRPQKVPADLLRGFGVSTRHRNPLPCPRKADLDNLAKAVLDAIFALWEADDRQVSYLSLRKWIAPPNTEAGVLIELKWGFDLCNFAV